MRIINTISVFVALSVGAFAQGIQFEDLSFEAALARATAEDKLVFIDFYTDWCGPCKRLDRQVFPLAEVGELFNAKFVSIKVDAEKGEGPALSERYRVKNYPTLQFVDGEGSVLHRVVGFMSAEELNRSAGVAIDPDKRLATWSRRYELGERGLPYLKAYVRMLQKAGDGERLQRVGREFMAYTPQDELLDAEAFAIIRMTDSLNYGSKTYRHMLAQRERYVATDGIGQEGYDRVMTACVLDYLRGLITMAPSLEALRAEIKRVKSEHVSPRIESWEKGAENKFYLAHRQYERWFDVNEQAAREVMKEDEAAGARNLLNMAISVAHEPSFLEMAGAHDRAIGLVEEVLTIKKENLLAHSCLARLHKAKGDKEEALKSIRTYITRYEATGGSVDSYTLKLKDEIEGM